MSNWIRKISLIQFLIFVAQGWVIAFIGFGSTPVLASSDLMNPGMNQKSQMSERIILAQHEAASGCSGPRHGGRGRHCSDMGQGRDCPREMEGCSGRKGMGHRGGMGRGMHHGGGKSGPAQCPQTRTTVKAPDEFYGLSNPIESTPDNIEKGRLLFQLDAQPSCVMCHGSQGDGTGGFGANLSPSPRNFTCSATMQGIPDGQLFWIIRNGSPDTGMPPFQDLKDEQVWQLIHYLRELGKK